MSIDLETYSDVDIKKSGVYKYAESENFEILLFAVSINGDDVIVYDLACGDVLPDEILDAIVSDDVIKWAFNASFERMWNFLRVNPRRKATWKRKIMITVTRRATMA
jgi:DNA polymerase